MKLCECGQPKVPHKNGKYTKWRCPACEAARQRRIRADNPGYSSAKNARWKAANRPKYLAHKAVEYALKTGKLTINHCEVCQTLDNIQAHHDDYDRPLDVRWFCNQHHPKD